MLTTGLRMALVTIIALMLQTTLFADVRVGGVAPEIVLAVAVITGFVAGPHRGAFAAFWMGLSYDFLLDTPIGLAALTFCLVAYAAGLAGEVAFRPTWWFASGSCAVASGAGVVMLFVVSTLVGQDLLTGSILKLILGVALFNAVFAPAIMAVVRWSYGRPHELRAAT